MRLTSTADCQFVDFQRWLSDAYRDRYPELAVAEMRKDISATSPQQPSIRSRLRP